MSRKHTRLEVLDMIYEAEKEMNSFYRMKFVNYTGTTLKADGNEFYTEIVCEHLLNHFDLFDKINGISRAEYKVLTHTGTTPRPTSNRLEERIALSLFGKNLNPIGKFIDYQVPLKSVQKDKAGKIDLVAFDDATGVLRLIELKAPKSKETLLRCVLEIFTYYKTVHIPNLLKSYGLDNKCTKIKICPLFFKNSTQDDEYNSLKNRDNLCDLMHKISDDHVELELLRFPFDDVKWLSCGISSQVNQPAADNDDMIFEVSGNNSQKNPLSADRYGDFSVDSIKRTEGILLDDHAFEIEILKY